MEGVAFKAMIWINSIEEIQIKHKKCGCVMKLESQRNNKTAVYVCPFCKNNVFITVGRR